MLISQFIQREVKWEFDWNLAGSLETTKLITIMLIVSSNTRTS